ncbi:MAG: hypothetical protein ACRDSJ_10540 [Rubrobacteraceae bacterium]
MEHLSEEYRDANVLSLERSIVGTCGKAEGESRWKPLFNNLTVVNHGQHDGRAVYNLSDDIRLAHWDLVLNPNLLHHVRDQNGLFRVMTELVGKETELYIFDHPFVEVHDVPGHYCLYTPYGIRDRLEREGLSIVSLREVVNHWDAILYCVDFAMQKEPDLRASDILKDPKELLELAMLDYPPIGRRMCMAWTVRAKRA